MKEFAKRRHQVQFDQILDRILAGEAIGNILAAVTPGGGKSPLVAMAANKLIHSGRADFFAWLVPRLSLADQGQEMFLERGNPFNPHGLTIRQATNDCNPCRGQNGFVTCFKSVECDAAGTLAQMFESKRGILIIDECHHMYDGSVLHRMIRPFLHHAVLRIYLSGNLSRGDKKRIGEIPYLDDGMPDFDAPGWASVRYGRRQAILDRAKIPIEFAHFDGAARWIDRDGEIQEVASIRKKGVFAAIRTEYADGLLDSCLAHFSDHKRFANPRAKCLVVACSIKEANRLVRMVKDRGFRAGIAVCALDGASYSKQSREAIKRFKAHGGTSLDVLITVQMAYEGLDVPSITHIACLTEIRSWAWIEQMFDRGTRVDYGAGPYESQRLYAWTPDDIKMGLAIGKIKAEQPDPATRMAEDAGSEPEDDGDGGGAAGDGEYVMPGPPDDDEDMIIPLAGSITEVRYSGDHGEEVIEVSAALSRKISATMSSHGILGSPLDFIVSLREMGLAIPESLMNTPEDPPEPFVLGEITENQEAAILRSKIQKRCGAYDKQQGWDYGRTNGKVKRAFGKGRDEMEVGELRMAWAWICRHFEVREAQ